MMGEVIRRFIGRCVLSTIDDSTGVQNVQVEILGDELHDGVERFQQFGFTSVPFPEAEGIVVFVGGSRSHGVVIATEDRRHRPRDLEPGESALYDDQDQIIRIYRDRIEIKSPLKIVVDAPTVEVTADEVTVTADSVDLGGSGGPAVARVGDSVAGGVITSGSSKVRAV